MGQRLQVHVDNDETWDILYAVGEIDIGTVEIITASLATAGPKLIVELTGTSFMDSSGLASLMKAHHERSSAGSLVLVCNAGAVRRLLEVSGVDQVIPVHATLEAATS